MTGHRCHARGCKKVVAHHLLMCPAHWRQVPRELQTAVWDAYLKHGALSPPWLAAAEAAIAAVAAADPQGSLL